MPEEWLNAPGSDCSEKCEKFTLTCFYYLPVCVTFGLLTVLTTFYVLCFLLPSLNGDFTTLGINDYWANDAERDADMETAFILAIIFGFCVLSLLTAILLTMCTDPGSVPQDKEFDAPDNQELAAILKQFAKDKYDVNSDESIDTHDMTIAEPLMNKSIERDQKYPLNSSHIDMGLILSKQGPLYENEFGDPE